MARFDEFIHQAEWQYNDCWNARLKNAKDADKAMMKSSKVRIHGQKSVNKCSIHGPDGECPAEKALQKVGKCLDAQFEYLLAMAESYKELLNTEVNADKAQRVNLWLQEMSKIDRNSCTHMKGIRNDYAMVLVGYLANGELKGPFEDHPPGILQPLTQAIATFLEKRAMKMEGNSPLNPASDTIENFLCEVPSVEEGAFALLSISGNLFNFRK